MIFVVRAAMAVLLLLGAYVLAAGMVAVLGFAVYEGFVHGFGGVLLGKGMVLLLILTLALGRALWAARMPKDLEPDGLAITPDDQPRLWEEVRAVATTIGTRAPDEIRLVAEVNAAVTEESRWLGLVGGRRVNALILKRLGWGESLVAVFRHGSMDPMRTVVRHVASIPLPRLLEDPRAEVFTWDRVGATTVSGRVLALTLDGRVRRVRVETHRIAGDLVDSLRQHLGHRFVLVA
ncbi:MAG TPA: hypothetical protein VFO49_02170 [Nocardioides sp.]|nr:hypothetical protein [Nocardioides sp.]